MLIADDIKVFNRKRVIYYDFIRIIAAALVIFNHLKGYTLYQISSGYKQWFYLFCTMITRINVPLFFMVTGALLFSKNESIVTIIKKRVVRIFLVLLLFSLIIYVLYDIKDIIQGKESVFTFVDFIKKFLNGNIRGAGAYWYLYSYIGLLFMLPFMQSISKKINSNDIMILLIIHFVISSILPIINLLLKSRGFSIIGISGYFSVPFATTKAFFYTLLGYYIDNMDIKCKKSEILLLISITIVGIVLSNICTIYERKTMGKYTQNYVQLFDYVTAIVIYILIKIMFTLNPTYINDKIANFICFFGSLTFGIYLLDPIWKIIFYNKFEKLFEPKFPTIIVSLFWVVFSFSISSIVTLIIKKVPHIGKLL